LVQNLSDHAVACYFQLWVSFQLPVDLPDIIREGPNFCKIRSKHLRTVLWYAEIIWKSRMPAKHSLHKMELVSFPTCRIKCFTLLQIAGKHWWEPIHLTLHRYYCYNLEANLLFGHNFLRPNGREGHDMQYWQVWLVRLSFHRQQKWMWEGSRVASFQATHAAWEQG